MQRSNAADRRSSRIPAALPILVTSLGPGAHFSEICETLVVSAHGCSMRSPVKLDAGVPVHLHSKEGRQTTAQVVYCQPMEAGREGWKLGASLDWPDNFWGLKTCPADWTRLAGNRERALVKTGRGGEASGQAEGQLRQIMAELVKPLQDEVVELREKLGHGEPKRSRFEVSLSQIPPELEEQLEQRLRKDLGSRVLEQTRAQSAQLLEAAKQAIDEKTTRTHDAFLEKVTSKLQSVEKRAQGISEELAEKVRQQFQSGLDELHGHVVDAGHRLERRSEDLSQGLQRNLTQEHQASLGEMRGLQAEIASDSSRLQSQVADLDGRIAKLDESARTLESGLDRRLTQMAHETVNSARSQLEGAVDLILTELATRSGKELGKQVDDACEHLRIIQKGIESSASSTLRGQVTEALQGFEHSMNELAQQSVDSWRHTLASGLNSLARILGEQFQLEAAPNGNKNPHARGE